MLSGLTFSLDLKIEMPADHDSEVVKTALKPAAESHDDFIELNGCFECQRVDLRLIDYGGLLGCQGCIDLATDRMEKALGMCSSEGSVRSVRSSASSRGDVEEESSNMEEGTVSRDSDESVAAQALTALTSASAKGHGSDLSPIEDSDEDSESDEGSDAEESSDEEGSGSGKYAESPQQSRANMELQLLKQNIFGERPEIFEAVTVFQHSTEYTVYQPFLVNSKSQGVMLDFGRWKLYKSPLVLQIHSLSILTRYYIGKPRPISPVLSLHYCRRGVDIRIMLCDCDANVPRNSKLRQCIHLDWHPQVCFQDILYHVI